MICTALRALMIYQACGLDKKEATFDKQKLLLFGGEEGIRTLVGLPPNGFQDRLVMTTSIPLRIVAMIL